MVLALKNTNGAEERLLRCHDPNLIANVLDFNLSAFVTRNTMEFFEITGISSDFLKLNSNEWENNEEYLKGRQQLKDLKVVNDCAERGVSLIEKFTGKQKKCREYE
uniref:(northern house mosquito) hypothetical protein n=1 Tax=Culex pipiens TaxID=7175 RepID=A0A8D8J4W1_CULPI